MHWVTAEYIGAKGEGPFKGSQSTTGKFMRRSVTELNLTKLQLMTASSRWLVIDEGLKCAQGRSFRSAIAFTIPTSLLGNNSYGIGITKCVEEIKRTCPCLSPSGGLSDTSFSFRGLPRQTVSTLSFVGRPAMGKFMRLYETEPNVAKVPLTIESAKWSVSKEGGAKNDALSLHAAITETEVKEVGPAEVGLMELTLVEVEMPGLQAVSRDYGPAQLSGGWNSCGSSHVAIQTGVVEFSLKELTLAEVETMVALGAKVRWASCDEPAANHGERKITKALKDADAKRKSKDIMSLRDTLAELKSDRDTANTVAEAVSEYDTQLKMRCVAKPVLHVFENTCLLFSSSPNMYLT